MSAEVVTRQVAAGIDIVNDGEMSKPSYATYIKDRLDGFGGQTVAGVSKSRELRFRRQRTGHVDGIELAFEILVVLEPPHDRRIALRVEHQQSVGPASEDHADLVLGEYESSAEERCAGRVYVIGFEKRPRP